MKLDLNDIQETRKRFAHEVPFLYREAFDALLAEVTKRQYGCRACGCTAEQGGLALIRGPGGLCLCVTCIGLFHMLTRDMLREIDDREEAQKRDEADRLRR